MAAEVFFTTNPAEFVQLEGLYVNEKDPPGFIRGRSLSTVGFAGKCVRGPLTPQAIDSSARFTEVYGERDNGAGGAIVGEVWKALLNKPFGSIVVRRVAAAAAVVATVNMDDAVGAGGTNIIRIDASSVGTWGNSITATVEAATSLVATQFNLTIEWLTKTVKYENLDTNSTTDNLLVVIGDDLGNLVTVTKLAPGRPHNQSLIALAGGTDGTIANGDYTTAATDLANYSGVAICVIPEAAPTQATLNATLVTLASQVSDRIFLTWSGVNGDTPANEATAVGAQITTRSDRIVWCYNAGKTLDPTDATKVSNGPHVWLASILCQNDVDIHPGDEVTKKQLAGVSDLHKDSLTRAELVTLRAAGISTLEKVSGGFRFRSGVTTSLATGLTEITRRRSADFLQLSASDRLKYFVRKKNTTTNRALMGGELIAFSSSYEDQERIIESFQVDQVSVNTTAQRALGIERILWRVKLIGHLLHLVLETEIGTGVTIEAA